MALALLNQEGIVAGCEGDQRTVFTMLLVHALTGQVPFMANPSGIDAPHSEAIFAHCTIAPSMTSGYAIRSHFESGIGVGIQGIVPEGKVTVLKVGGPSLDRYFVSSGKIVENLDDPRRCRTQLRIELTEDASYFLRSPLANHHVIVKGDYADALASFMDGEGAVRAR
jgi:L-fucose isomerase-like protein